MRNLFVCFLFSLTSACSVVLAANGSREPNITKLSKGASRAAVEQEFGPERSSKTLSDGTTEATYRYKLGDKAAPGRAAVYLLLDIVTFAFAEYALFPLEISNSGNAYQARVHYDSTDHVIQMFPKEEIRDEKNES